MSTDDATERQALIATLARWNIEGRLDTIIPSLSDAQLLELLILLDAIHELGHVTGSEGASRV